MGFVSFGWVPRTANEEQVASKVNIGGQKAGAYGSQLLPKRMANG